MYFIQQEELIIKQKINANISYRERLDCLVKDFDIIKCFTKKSLSKINKFIYKSQHLFN
jgi:hypothetical protein